MHIPIITDWISKSVRMFFTYKRMMMLTGRRAEIGNEQFATMTEKNCTRPESSIDATCRWKLWRGARYVQDLKVFPHRLHTSCKRKTVTLQWTHLKLTPLWPNDKHEHQCAPRWDILRRKHHFCSVFIGNHNLNLIMSKQQ